MPHRLILGSCNLLISKLKLLSKTGCLFGFHTATTKSSIKYKISAFCDLPSAICLLSPAFSAELQSEKTSIWNLKFAIWKMGSKMESGLAMIHFVWYGISMARPLRIEFPGAVYHVTSRGNERKAIFMDDEDRGRFSDVLSIVVERFNWLCHAYCLMANHYHLLIETPNGNLSKGVSKLGSNFYPWLCLYFTKVSFWPPSFFPENEEISTPPPLWLLIADCWLEYIYFMKNGQPKLSERETQRCGLLVTPTYLQSKLTFIPDHCGKKGSMKFSKLGFGQQPVKTLHRLEASP